MFKTSDFYYQLDKTKIAQSPVHPRDSAKLMLLNTTTNKISHHLIKDLPTLLPKKYTVVVNNTKVFPARLQARKTTGGKLEILLLKQLKADTFECLTKPGLKPSQTFTLSDSLTGTCLRRTNEIATIIFKSSSKLTVKQQLYSLGTMPIPPYITTMLKNSKDYQTIYAKSGFSAAAPTAGLHFTPELLTAIDKKYSLHELTLNVGLGTFQPVKEKIITEHKMHKESYIITAELAQKLNKFKSDGKKILAIGTTTTRALESAVDENGEIYEQTKETDIFIYPPYKFRFVDALLTNFHLPKSTLLMMVSAFISSPNTKTSFTSFKESLLYKAYQQAIQNNYRFYSFGDAMLII